MVEDGEAGLVMRETEKTGEGAERPTDAAPADELATSAQTGEAARSGEDCEPAVEDGGGDEPECAAEPGDDAASQDGAETPDDADAGPESPEDTTPADEERILRSVAALVFASPEPLGAARLVSLLEGPRPAQVRGALEELARRLEAAGLPLELRQIAGGWRLVTAPDTDEVVRRLQKARKVERLSPAGLETLAVVAYRQPVTKAEVEAIRGVQCGPMLRGLVDRGLVRVTGRSDQPGHALEYGTTRAFLDRFGLARLEDLPRDGELLG
ncbi:MAG: SMC-Scp complex subunit ScpB [Planctomycetota bacterium]|jgi:segregation and condensation protein B|nr:SMC-Scp complex subunit ScpB [Planctomycetota bacterium]MDP6763437.1 SMC-Scp complex subunit ScpB [Planctomycetota bacterium]